MELELSVGPISSTRYIPERTEFKVDRHVVRGGTLTQYTPNQLGYKKGIRQLYSVKETGVQAPSGGTALITKNYKITENGTVLIGSTTEIAGGSPSDAQADVLSGSDYDVRRLRKGEIKFDITSEKQQPYLVYDEQVPIPQTPS